MKIQHTRKGFLGIYWATSQNIEYNFSIEIWADGKIFAPSPGYPYSPFQGKFNNWKWEKYSDSFTYSYANYGHFACFTKIVGYVKTPDLQVDFNLK